MINVKQSDSTETSASRTIFPHYKAVILRFRRRTSGRTKLNADIALPPPTPPDINRALYLPEVLRLKRRMTMIDIKQTDSMETSARRTISPHYKAVILRFRRRTSGREGSAPISRSTHDMIVSKRSSHSGFISSISLIFQARFQNFRRFSR